MSNLYGQLDSDAGSSVRTRRGHAYLEASAQNYDVVVKVYLDKQGRFRVQMRSVQGQESSSITLAEGQVADYFSRLGIIGSAPVPKRRQRTPL